MTRLLPRYKLRTLLLFMVACSLLLGWYASGMARKRAERAAAEVVHRLGGACLTEEIGDCVVTEPPQFRLDDYLSRLALGPYIIDVSLRGCSNVEDRDLRCLHAFRHLRVVNLSGTGITDASVAELMRIRSLTYLDVTGTKVTPGAAQTLQESLPQCKVVY